MRPPRLASVVQRRLLVNYRVDPEVLARRLPQPLRPQLANDWAVAGICLIRLGRLRPRYVPAALGLRSENAAHRFVVEWDTPDGTASGVYIARRDSGSLLNVAVGGRLFPGLHHRARFDVRETAEDLRVSFTSADRTTHLEVAVRTTQRWPASRLFANLDEASSFFQQGAAGYSVCDDPRYLDGMHLETTDWRVEPVELEAARSSFFDDPARFPHGSATLDCALLMRDMPANWNPLPPMRVGTGDESDHPASTAR
jgi:uncharacterized protein YqjF (DUF2071 family)